MQKQEWYCNSSQSRASNLVTSCACFFLISEFEHLRPRRFQLCSQIIFPRSWVPGCLSLKPSVEQWNTFLPVPGRNDSAGFKITNYLMWIFVANQYWVFKLFGSYRFPIHEVNSVFLRVSSGMVIDSESNTLR